MDNIVNVNMGEMAVGKNSGVLATAGVGSCVVVCIYDKEQKIGGLAHTMLPRQHKELVDFGDHINSRYIDVAIPKLLEEIEALGAKRENLIAKLVGGANIFQIFSSEKGKSIGEQNIESARAECEKFGIKIIREDVGGTGGKSVEFNLANGVLNVNLKM
jgi:chemotaxis protein CheD